MNKRKEYTFKVELTDQELKVLKVRWGQWKTLLETAKELGVTRERIRQVESALAMRLMDSLEQSEKEKEAKRKFINIAGKEFEIKPDSDVYMDSKD